MCLLAVEGLTTLSGSLRGAPVWRRTPPSVDNARSISLAVHYCRLTPLSNGTAVSGTGSGAGDGNHVGRTVAAPCRGRGHGPCALPSRSGRETIQPSARASSPLGARAPGEPCRAQRSPPSGGPHEIRNSARQAIDLAPSREYNEGCRVAIFVWERNPGDPYSDAPPMSAARFS